MKHLSLSLIAASAIAMVGCSSDEPATKVVENNGVATFNLVLPTNINSRAISDGTTVEDLHWAIFNENGELIEEFSKAGAFAGTTRSTKVEIQLVNGKQYKVAFWAQHPDAPYSFEEGKVIVHYDNGIKDANDEVRDAFYGTYGTFLCTSTFQPSGDIILHRPFAQVNVGTSDWDVAALHDAVPTKTGMTFSAEVYTTLNLFDGSVSGVASIDYDLANLPDNDGDATTVDDLTITKPDNTTATYKWIGMNYILVPADKQTVTTLTFTHNYENGEVAFNHVPVQRNYRTNIVGNLLTSTSDWSIVIDEDFNTPDFLHP